MKRQFRVIAVFFIAAAPYAAIVPAADSPTQRDIETMRHHRRLAEPERSGDTGLEIQLRGESWRKLRVGMSEAEVEKLLGKPNRIEAVDGMIRWHYERDYDKGWVGFAADTRAVLEWRYY